MAQVQLESNKREQTGKGVARRLRMEGRLPGVLYGPTIEPICLDLDEKSLMGLISEHGVNPVIKLTIDDKGKSESHLCMIKEMQRDIYKTHITHLDLRRVDLKEHIAVTIKLNLEGVEYLRSKGALVEQTVRGVRVKTLPSDIPESITADISKLRLGQTLTLGQLDLPAGLELLMDANTPVVNIFAARGAIIEQAPEE